MSYATMEDLMRRTPDGEILQLAPEDENGEQIDVKTVELALSDAAETINSLPPAMRCRCPSSRKRSSASTARWPGIICIKE